MNKTQRLALFSTTAVAVAGLLWGGVASAKTINIADQNTAYSNEDVQKLASTAVSMGVKEPVKLNLQGGDLIITGSSATQCVIKVGSGNTPKITGVSCK